MAALPLVLPLLTLRILRHFIQTLLLRPSLRRVAPFLSLHRKHIRLLLLRQNFGLRPPRHPKKGWYFRWTCVGCVRHSLRVRSLWCSRRCRSLVLAANEGDLDRKLVFRQMCMGRGRGRRGRRWGRSTSPGREWAYGARRR
ncbi:hypothetical protein B0H16DRAFT_991715 [Mycena metata]|uniref:Secreted protein n=1 Tax=Mycena metata TaxID=1033252 RepID=A0AAD7IJ63_9AGAR|nr:hypothetical protein B0H16DRAFT_991715 [Mycena metata]